ncbi:hypothetical protein VQ7734_03527 [Vibrio quintilis]|uniref:Uncharacterized protein n=1 Tax=Vibrio quintilis TaxID=1117707 RepID=A0A1M7YYK1_9VIBR|nr:hypothetical protein VQ7734_03527 [Vibrio quintilis]
MLLSGCSATPATKVIVKTEYQKQSVPDFLTRDTAVPNLPKAGATNAQLAEYMVGMESALNNCNIDKKSIRQWQNHTQPPP